MITLRIYIGNSNYVLDLMEDPQISLTRTFADLEDLNEGTGAFSKSFRIPAHGNNQDVFGQLFNINDNSGTNVRARFKARLEYNTLPFASGFVHWVGAIATKDGSSTYEIVFYAETSNLARALNEKRLIDVDLSSYTHVLNYANVTDSWSGALLSGAIRYGLVDKGQNWDDSQETIWSEESPLYPADFTPFIRFRELVEAIFSDAGFTIDSDLLASTRYDDIYFLAYGGSLAPVQDADTADSTFKAVQGADDSVSVSDLDADGYYTPSLNDSTGTGFDNGTNWENAAGPVDAYWNPPYSGTFTVQADLTLYPTTGVFTYIQLHLYDVTSGTSAGFLDSTNLSNLGTCGVAHLTFTGPVQVNGANNYELRLKVSTQQQTGSLFTIKQDGLALGGDCGNATSFFRMISADTQPLFGFDVDVAANMPDITQLDLLRSWKKLENLLFIPDEYDDTKIKVVPYGDYVGTGDTLDWSQKLDLEFDRELFSTVDRQASEYIFTYSEGEDVANTYVQDTVNRVYGRHRRLDLENEISTGEHVVETEAFAPFIVTELPLTSNIYIHRMLTSDADPISDPLGRIAFWCGMQNGNMSLWLYDDSITSEVEHPQYPGFHSSNDPFTPDVDLLFGYDTPLYVGYVPTSNTRYWERWFDYVSEVFRNESRILRCRVYLNPLDVATFKFSDRIWLEDAYWRVLKIEDFDVSGMASTKVELIKILTPQPQCTYVPDSISNAGIVTFVDEAGSTSAGNEACCIQYGYTWTGTKCLAFDLADDGQVPTPGGPSGGGGGGGSPGGQTPTDGIVLGGDITAEAGSPKLLAYGEDISITGTARNPVAIGEGITIATSNDREATIGLRNSVYAFVEGTHIGGGWWYSNDRNALRGTQQFGFITMSYEGSFNTGAEIELWIDGKYENRLSMPNNSAWGIMFYINITTQNASTGALVASQFQVYYDRFTKIGNKAFNIFAAHRNAPHITNGTWGTSTSQIHMDIDTTTDMTQHRVIMHNQSRANTDPTRIVAMVQYVQSRYSE